LNHNIESVFVTGNKVHEYQLVTKYSYYLISGAYIISKSAIRFDGIHYWKGDDISLYPTRKYNKII